MDPRNKLADLSEMFGRPGRNSRWVRTTAVVATVAATLLGAAQATHDPAAPQSAAIVAAR